MNQDRPETRGELLDAWTRHLSLRRGLSEHTVRAYAGDLEDLLGFLGVEYQSFIIIALIIPC